MFRTGDKVISKRYGEGEVTGDSAYSVKVRFADNWFGYYQDGTFVGSPEYDKITLIEKEKEQVKFSVGDKVRLKEKFYDEEVFKQAHRAHRLDWAKNRGSVMTFGGARTWNGDDIKNTPCAETNGGLGGFIVPLSLLELVEKPKPKHDDAIDAVRYAFQAIKAPKADTVIHNGIEYRKVNRQAKVGELVLIIKPWLANNYIIGDVLKVNRLDSDTNGLFCDKSYVSSSLGEYLVLEQINTMHHWTDAEIREAKELSYQMILDANQLICFGFYSDKTKAYAQYESASSEPSNLDAYNRDIGVCVALCKLLGKPIPSFIRGDKHD